MRFDGIQGFGGGPMPGVDPDTYAQKYADEHGITLEEAKTELRAKYGDPQQPGMSKQDGLLQFRKQDSFGFYPNFTGRTTSTSSTTLSSTAIVNTSATNDYTSFDEIKSLAKKYIIAIQHTIQHEKNEKKFANKLKNT